MLQKLFIIIIIKKTNKSSRERGKTPLTPKRPLDNKSAAQKYRTRDKVKNEAKYTMNEIRGKY